MSRTHKDARNYHPKQRHISVRAVRRDPPDLRKLSRALIELAMAEAAAEAEAQHDNTVASSTPDEDAEADEATRD
jgi:hypothetical protein